MNLSSLAKLALQFVQGLDHIFLPLALLQSLLHLVGDIGETFQETDGKPLCIKFLIGIHRPESIFQIVVLYGAELLDSRITTVMVGKEEALIRDYLSRTAVAENDNCVLQRRIVQVIYFLRSNLKSQFCHPAAVHFLQQRQKPHSLIRPHGSERQKEQHQAQKFNFFHFCIDFDICCLLKFKNWSQI